MWTAVPAAKPWRVILIEYYLLGIQIDTETGQQLKSQKHGKAFQGERVATRCVKGKLCPVFRSKTSGFSPKMFLRVYL